MTPKLMNTIRRAARIVEERYRSQPLLIGTAGLAAYGFQVEPHDIDFLVVEDDMPSFYTEDSSAEERLSVDGMAVHVCNAKDAARMPFYHPATAVRLLGGVSVAQVDDIIGLKRSRSRPKDIEFLRGWDAWAKTEPTFLFRHHPAGRRIAYRLDHSRADCVTCINEATGHGAGHQ